ncbi:hypothetical protein [Lysinibacillus sphaericus]|uniref:hypothetical protein n=1 Tax=Lysinibacillus sphaericus TaxID=1421 RepID=UPI000C1A19EB|nr:hypothetical protein [Lysinibacillus sphaericus]PIJ98036.1 hypothetical protein CTN02_09850 [Lysinibacillus sphaericus]
MKKKYFKLSLLFIGGGALGSIITSIFFSWTLEKYILFSDQVSLVNNTGEIIHIIQDYNEEKVQSEYVVELLDRRIEDIKSNSYEVLSRGKSDSKYANYGAALEQIVYSLEGVKEKVLKRKEIDVKKDMDEFLNAIDNYTTTIQEIQ